MRLNLTRLLLLFLATVPLAFGGGYFLGRRQVDPPVATVNGEAITSRELDAELASRFGAEVLNDMVNARLVSQEAARRKLTVTPEELEKRVDEMVGQPRVKAMIEAGRIGREDLERNLRTVMLLDKLILGGITTEQQKTYLDVHREELEMVRASHILVASEEDALRLQEQLAEGADFAQLAREHSLDDTSRAKGGDLGYFRRGELDPNFVEVAFATEVDEVSAVVPTRLGYHLIQVTGRKSDFKSLQADIREAMVEERRTDFVKALEKGAKIERKLRSARVRQEP